MWNSIQSSSSPAVRLLACLLLASLACCSGCTDGGGPDTYSPAVADAGQDPSGSARLVELAGSVEWEESTGHWKLVVEGQPIAIGDRLRTDKHASFVLLFPDGGRLRIEGESKFGMTDVEDELALLVEEAELELAVEEQGPKGYQVLFADSADVLLVRRGRLGLTVQQSGVQLEMHMGDALIRRGQQEIELVSGARYQLELGKGRVTSRDSLQTTLVDKRRLSVIRPPGAKRFQKLRKWKLTLEPGVQIKTSPKAAVEWTDPAGGKIVLQPNSRATFEGAFRSGGGREGRLGLDLGEARIHLRREADRTSSQEVVTPHARVTARATGLTSAAEVKSTKKDTRITVHAGSADVAIGDRNVRIPASHYLTVRPGQEVREPAPMSASRIRAKEGARTRVFYDRPVRVTLSWAEEEAGGSAHLEISGKSSFDQVLLREPVFGNSFTYSLLPAGRYHWRVVRAGGHSGPVGRLDLGRDPMAGRRQAGKLSNVVPDTGVQTTIYFQGKVPALTFNWNPLPEATSYQVSIYSEDDMASPLHQQTLEQTRLVLPAGKLEEGTYFWYKTARDAAGEEMKTTGMNKLVLVFDNTAPLLRIDSPRTGQRPVGGTIQVSGLAAAGTRVRVNDQPIEPDASGRFKKTLLNVTGGSMLVFHVMQTGGADAFFTRHLGR